MKRTATQHPALTLIGLLLAFALPELVSRFLAVGDGIDARLGRETVWWAIGAAMLMYVLAIERRPLSSIGLKRPGGKTLLFGLLAAIVMIATIGLYYSVLFPLLGLPVNQEAGAQLVDQPMWFLMLLVLRAAVVEEILYRGYPIERIQELTGSKWLAALIPAALFTAGHLSYWGATHLIIVGFGALILTLLYLWRRDLICNMLAHGLLDLVGFLVVRANQAS